MNAPHLDPPSRRRPALLRGSALPWLGAACVAAAVVGAAGAAPGLASTAHPAGAAATTSPAPAAPPAFWMDGRRVTAAEEAAAHTPAHRMQDPAEANKAYGACAALVRDQASVPGGYVPQPKGKLAATNGLVTTVVVADSRHAWTCNTAPDHALTPRLSATSPGDVADPVTWAVALNSASNYWRPAAKYCEKTVAAPAPTPTTDPRVPAAERAVERPARASTCIPIPSTPQGIYSGELLWTGGHLPPGVTGLTYVLPSGRRIPAVVAGGWWVVQDLSRKDWAASGFTGAMTVELSDGRTTVVPLGPDTVCHQVTHGC